MMAFLGVMAGLVFAALLLAAGTTPRRSRLNHYQRQQAAASTAADALELRREAYLVDVLSLQRVISALLLVALVALLVAVFGWLYGLIAATVIALEYGAIARLPLLQRGSQALYNHHEVRLLAFIARHGRLFGLLRANVPAQDAPHGVRSRDELVDMIAQTKAVVTADEKAQLLSGLAFSGRTVGDVMTERDQIDSIDHKELLGPLVLDDLHKTGHSRFPVTNGDIDTIIGVLDVKQLLSLDSKKSATAEKSMDPQVFYLHHNQPLEQALAAFLRSGHMLFVVINQDGETVGLISLADVLTSLIGRSISDEFDSDSDQRAVSQRAVPARRPHNKPKRT